MTNRRRQSVRPGEAAATTAPSARPVVRGRAWIDWGGAPALTDAGADLLEQIEVCGSLSEAARRLKFSYRRAWLLADAMNRRCPVPVLTLTTGGRRGGGARLTGFGRALVAAYRDLQLQLEHFLGQAGISLASSLANAPGS